MTEYPPYPSGLRLAGRRVVVVGGGNVAQRRVPVLIAAGADVVVVSPQVTPAIEGLSSEIAIELRGFVESDLDDTWYVIAATDDAEVNERVSAAAEERRIFCVRSDDATRASAWTPATGRHEGVTVAVLGNREPRKSAAIRDEILLALREGVITATHDRTPGVVLVGGGPGDPELVTIAARNALAVGRRGGRRPAGATRAARRAAGPCRADRRRQAPTRPVGLPGRDQPGHRRRALSPASASSGSKAGTASCSAVATRRCSPVPRPGSP